MYDSHRSLKEDYWVSSQELDTMVDAARVVEGVWGSRLTGAGFGGCTVSLVSERVVVNFKRHVGEAYRVATGLEPQFYVSRPEEGSGVVEAN